MCLETAGKIIGIGKSAHRGNFTCIFLPALQEPIALLHAKALQILHGAQTGKFLEFAAEMLLGIPKLATERLHRNVFGAVFLQMCQWLRKQPFCGAT